MIVKEELPGLWTAKPCWSHHLWKRLCPMPRRETGLLPWSRRPRPRWKPLASC